MSQRRITLLAAVTFLFVWLVGLAFTYLVNEDRQTELRAAVTEIGNSQGHALQRQLDLSLSATFALASILQQSGGKINNFDALAAEMIENYGGISSLQLAPDEVVQQIYPLAGNLPVAQRNEKFYQVSDAVSSMK